MQVADIIEYINSLVPIALQEEYDNSGLICGNSKQNTTSVLISLDCTEEIVDEAIHLGSKLIISHHPILFKPIKSLTGKNYIEKTIIKAIKNDICIFSVHTNLDNLNTGVNCLIAQKIGLKNLKILAPKSGLLNKIVVFCPHQDAEKVKNAMFEAGAGKIGNYSECSFNLMGEGTFRANEQANPYVGDKNTRHTEPETRIELICPVYKTEIVINKMLQAHPYEEVAYDVYPLLNSWDNAGSGMIGELPEASTEREFLSRLKKIFNAPVIKHTALLNKPITKVALCGGSGSFLLKNALSAGADVYVSADFKYHEFFDAEDRILIADIGHYESEQFTPEILATIIQKKFPTFAVHLTKINTNPVQYF